MAGMDGRFTGRRVLVTAADTYMGPAIAERFSGEGATVIGDTGRYAGDPGEPQAVVAAAGTVDILVVNLTATTHGVWGEPVTEQSWRAMFDEMVDPTMRFVSAALPQMTERGEGKIIVVTSAAPLRITPGVSAAYTAARGAQNAYVRAVGAEAARDNVQINAVGQNYVYGGYPSDAMDDPAMRQQVLRDVPAQRIAHGWEQAELVLFLASPNSNFICGQVVPFAGGWVTTA